MQLSAFFGKASVAAILALSLAACSTTAEVRPVSSAPIEVIESNYVESTNDAEIVRADSPFFFVSLGDLTIA
jgi:hypothetical protein